MSRPKHQGVSSSKSARRQSGHSVENNSQGPWSDGAASKQFPHRADADSEVGILSRFQARHFDPEAVQLVREAYQASRPYKHAVLDQLIDNDLLQSVRQEIGTKLAFTKKETDIYTIWQSGDLQNLNGLDASLAEQLPALRKLRDALYSTPFRNFLSEVTRVGPLSASKVDMAINVYTPGCHLLPHDDVIGSRKVSYILYLTDPMVDWQEPWGGKLRLYPMKKLQTGEGTAAELPYHDAQNSLRIGWNRLAFFAVQPGQSFHDVEEVYHADHDASDVERVRMAISGWYHVPQEGEQGYRAGELEEHERSSGRASLKSIDEFDRPQPMPTKYPEYRPLIQKDLGRGEYSSRNFPLEAGVKSSEAAFSRDPDPTTLTQGDIEFLLQYVSPRWLVPDTVAELKDTFADESCLRIDDFLQPHFANLLKRSIEAEPHILDKSILSGKQKSWEIAQPSHKQKYFYKLPLENVSHSSYNSSAKTSQDNPLEELTYELLPSQQFRKWLNFVTGVVLKTHDIRTRRFRRGIDYQLAMPYKMEEPRLEFTLGLTPGGKWGDEGEDEDNEAESISSQKRDGCEDGETEGQKSVDGRNGQSQSRLGDGLFSDLVTQDQQETNNGGYECWMADDEDGDDSDADTDLAHDADDPSSCKNKSQSKGKGKTLASDPAVYNASEDPSGDNGIAFSMPAGWNRLSLIMRDKGLLRFVKYVSRNAGCDRWDVAAEFGIDWDRTNEDAEYQDNDFFNDDGDGDRDKGDGDGNDENTYGFDEENVSGDASSGHERQARRKRRKESLKSAPGKKRKSK